METCSCERYKKIVEDFHFFTPGTLNSLIPRLAMPTDGCIAWKCNKANLQDMRPTKPAVIIRNIRTTSPEPPETKEEPLEAKWVPVMPGIVSQKAVNESKKLKTPF
ncbi:uncharacterized protein LOC126746387 [Anthonomus grandis grandis]|uniref:uncharacterized protein LOC126746387 n=1 Tax=Anthonomus grandis grandis TaxID=2921223 RepID=UPI002165AE70|nr:uncharacterized protein LOC126746387 [Anthonomus grandis grandis]